MLDNKIINCDNNNHITNLVPTTKIKSKYLISLLDYFYCCINSENPEKYRKVFTKTIDEGNHIKIYALDQSEQDFYEIE